jgi:hypothetical protein
MDLSQLLAARDAAGQRYAAAVNELHAALIDLAAIDEALMNATTGFDGRADIRTFFKRRRILGH